MASIGCRCDQSEDMRCLLRPLRHFVLQYTALALARHCSGHSHGTRAIESAKGLQVPPIRFREGVRARIGTKYFLAIRCDISRAPANGLPRTVRKVFTLTLAERLRAKSKQDGGANQSPHSISHLNRSLLPENVARFSSAAACSIVRAPG